MSNAPLLSSLSSRIAQLRIRDLLLLEHLHKLGSLRQVADIMHVTQPAITKVLKGLEQAFGTPLVDRGPQGVQLNAAGMAALQRLRAARHEVEAASIAVQRPSTLQLRLGATPVALQHEVPQALARLHERYPEIRVVVAEGSAPALWRQLAEGLLDALVGPLPNTPEKACVPEGIAYVPVGSEQMNVVASRSNPAVRATLSAAELAQQPWALPPADSLVSAMVTGWFLRQGVRPPMAKIVCTSYHCNLRLASCSDIFTVAPASAVRLLGSALQLTVVDRGFPDPGEPLMLAHRQSLNEHPAIVGLRACVGPTGPPMGDKQGLSRRHADHH